MLITKNKNDWSGLSIFRTLNLPYTDFLLFDKAMIDWFPPDYTSNKRNNFDFHLWFCWMRLGTASSWPRRPRHKENPVRSAMLRKVTSSSIILRSVRKTNMTLCPTAFLKKSRHYHNIWSFMGATKIGYFVNCAIVKWWHYLYAFTVHFWLKSWLISGQPGPYFGQSRPNSGQPWA